VVIYSRGGTIIQTDVVVIGSGGAGLTAAISSAKQGCSVVVLSKTGTGSASATSYSSGFFTFPDDELSVSEYREHVRRVGKNLSRENLLEVLGEHARDSLLQLRSWGATVRFLGGGHATITDSARIPVASGAGLISELGGIAAGHGVAFVENAFVTGLLVEGGRVFGVDYVDWTTGKTDRIFSKAVILATGGGGGIFRRTDSPARVTGDGYALALEAGLALEDMEFVQFYPLGFDEPHFPCWMIRLPVLDRARLTDGTGREFLREEMKARGLRDGMAVSLFARDMAARLIQERLAAGGEVLLHLEDIDRSCWKEWDLRKSLGCYPRGIAPWEYGPVHISPLAHYFCGGVGIDTRASTSVEGLFSAGEVTAGVDGASRVGGNALTGMVFTGITAGREAALLSRSGSPRPFKEKATAGPVQSGSSPARGLSPGIVRDEIKRLNQECLGPLREGGSILRGISALEEYRRSLSMMRTEKPADLLGALELKSIILTSLAVGYSALSREESRGVHFRTDRPKEVIGYESPQQVRIEGERFITRFKNL
jgi:succinate dehydrogenase/fumarate reductase flavoprotein subunit